MITCSYIDFINENFNTKSKFYSNIGLNTEDVFGMIDYHDSYRDLYPEYSSDNEYEEDYYFSSIQDAYREVNETLDFFNTLPNPILIYRTIKVKSVNDIRFDDLGESWSFDKESALNFAKNQNQGNYLITGKTLFDNVDWKNTIKCYYLFSDKMDIFGDNENEITIISSGDVFDISVEKI